MLYRLLADLVLVAHLAFVLFALLGGLLVWRHPKLAWLHVPALLWGVTVEWMDLVCPLTYLEISLRALGGAAGYSGGFVEHYIVPILYPAHLTLNLRYALGAILGGINLAAYACLLAAWRRRQLRGT